MAKCAFHVSEEELRRIHRVIALNVDFIPYDKNPQMAQHVLAAHVKEYTESRKFQFLVNSYAFWRLTILCSDVDILRRLIATGVPIRFSDYEDDEQPNVTSLVNELCIKLRRLDLLMQIAPMLDFSTLDQYYIAEIANTFALVRPEDQIPFLDFWEEMGVELTLYITSPIIEACVIRNDEDEFCDLSEWLARSKTFAGKEIGRTEAAREAWNEISVSHPGVFNLEGIANAITQLNQHTMAKVETDLYHFKPFRQKP